MLGPRRRRALIGAVLVLVSALAAACSSTASSSSSASGSAELQTYSNEADLVAAAKKEGTLNLFIAPEFVSFLVDAFKKEYPWAKVNYTGLEPPDAAAKLTAELNSGVHVTDVAGMFPPSIAPLVQKNQLARIQVPNDATILSSLQDPQNFYHPIIAVSVIYVYNTDLIDKPPATLEELSDSQWKDKLVTVNPVGPSDSGQALAMPRDTMGDADWQKWLQSVDDNNPQLTDSGTAAYQAVLRGDRPLCICDYQDYLTAPKDAPVAAGYWNQDSYGVLQTAPSAVVPKGAPDPAMAALWINFMLSHNTPDGGQNGVVKSGRTPVVKGVSGNALPPGVKAANFKDVLGDLMKRPDYYNQVYTKAFGQ